MLQLKNIELTKTLSVAFLIFFLLNIKVHFSNFDATKVTLFTIVILSYFFWFKSTRKFLFFAVLISSLILLTRIYFYYYSCGNHTFLAFYISLVLLFALSEKHSNSSIKILKINFKIFIAVIMLFAVIQKVSSPEFVSGDFFNFMFSVGGFFEFLKFIEPINIYFTENWNQINAFQKTDPAQLDPINYSLLFDGQTILLKYLSLFTLLIELILVGVLFLKNQLFKHLFFISFLVFTLMTRVEAGFLALLCIMFYTFLESEKKWLHFCYTAIYFCCVFMIFFGKGSH